MSFLARSFRFSLFLIAAVAPVFAQPSVNALANNYSGTRPGLPNYGIAPGSLFVIYGTGLATTANTTEAFPLTTNLSGTSVSVTVNGVTTQPTLYYVVPTQVGAVLPEGTPTGTGMLTVSVAGQPSQPVPIQVVQSDFGILTDNGVGFGPVAAYDTSYKSINATHPATPGELILFWGTGVGPDPANDDKTNPQQENNLTGIDMQVYIGGVQAKVYYKGRSAYPGVDEVFVYVPAGAPMGCYDSLATVSDGTITSNYGTIPVAPQGAASCTDQITLLSDWQTLSGKGSANLGALELVSNAKQTSAGTQTSSEAEGQFKTDNQVEIVSELFSDGFVSIGSCVVDQGNSAGSPTILTAGPNLTVSGPGGEQATFTYSPGATPDAYTVDLPGTFIPSSGGTFTFNGAGGPGAQIGSFNVSVTLPPAIAWTNMAAASSIIKPQGFTMNWTGGTADGIVAITGSSTGTAGATVKFTCFASAADGTFPIPPEVLLSLPDSTTSAKLGIANFENPVIFPASGLDLGVAFGGFSTTTQVANYQTTASPAPQLQSVSLSVSQTTSGSAIQGTVLLSSPAPPAGATVTLSSSSADVSVPSSVTIPAGATSANFAVSVGMVSSTEMVTIMATYENNSVQVMLTVNPPPTLNGTYTGTYNYTYQGQPRAGSVTATIDDGTVTVIQPGSGTGTITSSGQITFGSVVNGTTPCNFTGSIIIMGAGAAGSGTFSCTNPTVSGNWNVTRE